jgi:hypothetical protein
VLNLDDLFEKDQFDHPKLRYWQALAMKHGSSPIVEVFRDRDGLGFAPARLYVTVFDEHGRPAATDVEPWEPQLALTTAERGWRAPDIKNEAVRIGLLLKWLFTPSETRYGDGYFSSVLVEVIRDGDLARDQNISEILRFVSVPPPDASPAKHDCAESIKAVLGRVAQLLVDPLKYPQGEAKIIIAESIAYFLDERFSITSGKLLGLYQGRRAG